MSSARSTPTSLTSTAFSCSAGTTALKTLPSSIAGSMSSRCARARAHTQARACYTNVLVGAGHPGHARGVHQARYRPPGPSRRTSRSRSRRLEAERRRWAAALARRHGDLRDDSFRRHRSRSDPAQNPRDSCRRRSDALRDILHREAWAWCERRRPALWGLSAPAQFPLRLRPYPGAFQLLQHQGHNHP